LPEGIKKNKKYSFMMVFGSRFEPCTSRIKKNKINKKNVEKYFSKFL